jgi:uncharacterized SAM-binding protein YcdF (DUF218 family)
MPLVSPIRRKSFLLLGLLLLAFAVVVTLAYKTVPLANMAGDHFDAILVLGCPATLEGNPSREQRYRVNEGVLEYKRGRALHLILSGGAAANHYVEAQVMAQLAERLGVPSSAIELEGHSLNTFQNIQYSQQVMDAHGWRTVEVVTSTEHAHRAAVLLQATHLQWATHAAPTPGRKFIHNLRLKIEEALATAMLRILGDKSRPIIHVFAVVQGRIMYTYNWAAYNINDMLNGERPSMPYRPNYR